MPGQSNIHWTDASWNPVTGCSHVSSGCEHCYAEALSMRFGRSAKPWTAPNAAENVVLHPDRLDAPLKWREPRRVFVNSMSDLFHPLVPVPFIVQIFGIMARADQHTFQLLTKRPERMAAILGGTEVSRVADEIGGCPWPLPNVWAGTSIEQNRWVTRADHVRVTPAAVRFLSLEPLLEDLPDLDLTGIDWVIVGGESGKHFRPFDLDWARRIRDRCQAAGVAFFFKQANGFKPGMHRELDGRLWEEMPDGGAAKQLELVPA